MKTRGFVPRTFAALAALALAALLAPHARAAGTLTPVGAAQQPIHTRDHQVAVTIDNGFARTEVRQTFFNPNDDDLEAIFELPLPQSASLSEMTIQVGERELHGEVLPSAQAETLYEEEKSRGHDSGLGSKEGIQSFQFRVYPVRAHADTTVRFVYYQPLAIDTGVGRYVYPLAEGGTDDAAAASFWTLNDQVDGSLTLDVDLESAWPIADVRVPGFEAAATVTSTGEDRYHVHLERQQASLDADFVVYYRLRDDLPGRVELLAHRPDPKLPGTFMMVVTPALDLAPITDGSDYVFVLDNSGSMSGKLATLVDGVVRALGKLDPEDRFRVVVFSERARELVGWQTATPENVARAAQAVRGIGIEGGTNLYAGLQLAFDDLDDDRATSVVLVTDAVTNTGVVAPKAFYELLQQYDVRIFGFLMGNSANWPLMELIAETSGGFYQSISTGDDLLGQVLLAQEKVTHETLHGAEVKISGVRTSEVTGHVLRKVYRGQQLVVFGRYEGSGEAKVRLDAQLTGQDVTYSTRFAFPAQSDEHPELERLWALARVEEVEGLAEIGLLDPTEADSMVEQLGVDYQIVTDQTSMVVMEDASFEEHGVSRRNRDRVGRENAARVQRAGQPVRSHRVDEQEPMFGGRTAPSVGHGGGGGGGGAFGWLEALLLLAAGAFLAFFGRRS